MPLHKTITAPLNTQVFIWHITEDFNTLSKDVVLRPENQQRVDGMKSKIHQCGFMSVRHLLAAAGYTDQDLWYDKLGKPHLNDQKYISITHSFEYSAIIVSDQPVGIDIEKQRYKILKIAHKFTPLEEYRTLANEDAIMRKLTLVWCAKESLYKLYAQPGLSFLQHIYVSDFSLNDTHTQAQIDFNSIRSGYYAQFLEFDGFSCSFAYPLAHD